MYAGWAAYPTTPAPCPWRGQAPTLPLPAVLALGYGSPGLPTADIAVAAAAAPVAVPASPGSPAGSAAATADSKPEAEADWLASMGKRPAGGEAV